MRAIGAYKLLPERWTALLGRSLGPAELSVGVMLTFGVGTPAAAIAGAMLLVMFNVTIGAVLRRGRRNECHQGKAGLASVAAGPCSLNGLACALPCGTVVEWSCVYEFGVVCGGITALCPPCGGFCELVTIVVCTVTSIVSCYYVCHPC